LRSGADRFAQDAEHFDGRFAVAPLGNDDIELTTPIVGELTERFQGIGDQQRYRRNPSFDPRCAPCRPAPPPHWRPQLGDK
jgi:hypothetical protein